VRYDQLTLRIEPLNGDKTYRVHVDGEAGQAHGRFVLPFEDRDIENFVLRMSHGLRVRRVETSDFFRAKQFGGELFAALFQGEVRDLYVSCAARAQQAGRGLRVTLVLTASPELMDVPWEYLYDEPDFLAVSSWTPVVRSLDVPRPVTPLTVTAPLRVLGMISDPIDLLRLDVDGERRRLEDAFRPLKLAGRAEIQWTKGGTLEALLRTLRQSDGFHIFHFIGHGAYDEQRDDGLLAFEDGRGRSNNVTGDRLGPLLNDHRCLRLVVLNACEGGRNSKTDAFAGVATSLLRRGIPAVAAMQFEITDGAALIFAEHFYESLAGGHPVDAALAHARQFIFASGNDIEWGTPVLFLRALDGRIFELPVEQTLTEEAQLALVLEAKPTSVTAGEPVAWSLHVQNVGRSEVSEAAPYDGDGRQLGAPVDLRSGADHVFSWSTTAELGMEAAVTVRGKEPSGREVRSDAETRVDVLAPKPTIVLRLRPATAHAAPGKALPWRLTVANPGPEPFFEVVAEDAAGRRLAGPVEVQAEEQRELRWHSPALRSEEMRVRVHGRDARGREIAGWASATLTVGARPWWRPSVRATVFAVALVGLASAALVLRPWAPSPHSVWPAQLNGRPNGIAVVGRTAWVSSRDGGLVGIDLDRGTRVTADRATHGGTGVVAGDGALWLNVPGAHKILRLDPRTGHAKGPPVRVRGDPVAVALGRGSLWVAQRRDGEPTDVVQRFDPDTLRDRGSMVVAKGVRRIAYADGHIWALVGSGSGKLVGYEPGDGHRIGETEVGKDPQELAFGEGG
jgi:hypothetical protein